MMFIPVMMFLITASPPTIQNDRPTAKTVLEPYYLEDADLELAYRSYKRGNHLDARRRLRRIIESPINTNIARAARWLLVRSLENNDSTRRGSEWMQLVSSLADDPVLLGPVHIRLAEYYRYRGDTKNALHHYQRVPDTDVKTLKARLEAIRILLKQRKPAAALETVRRAEPLQQSRYARHRLHLLEADALRRTGQREDAIELLYAIWSDNPKNGHGITAASKLARLKARPTSAHHVVHTFASIDKGKKRSLQRLLRKTLRARRRAGKFAISYARGVIDSVSKKTRKSAIRRLKFAARSPRSYIAGHAMLRLARVLADMDKPGKALKKLETMAERYPSHPAAGEAVNRAAAIARKLQQPERAQKLMTELGARYEKHPRRIAFRWESAWESWRAGLYNEAAEQFRSLAKATGQRRHLGQATWFERATYWRANSEFEAGDIDRAVSLWQRLVVDYPLSYYSHQSFNRLMEHAPEQAKTLRPFEALDRYDTRSPADLTELPLQVDNPDLRLAAFLTRCGLFHDALNDLEHRAKSGRLSPDGMSLFMSLAVRLGRIQTRRAVSWFRGAVPQYPNSIYLQLWQRAYPLPFWKLIQQAAKQFQQPPLLILALIRHESRYKPTVTSRAKAVGLMQLLVATAKKMANRFVPNLGRVSRRTLKKPEVNIQLGTAFLAGLGRMFRGNQALMLAAYNAGPGRTRRWWREAKAEKQVRVDVFVEEIPYRETQGYVKSVLASYGVYRYLYGTRTDRGNRTIPLSNTLPESLGDFYPPQTQPPNPNRDKPAPKHSNSSL